MHAYQAFRSVSDGPTRPSGPGWCPRALLPPLKAFERPFKAGWPGRSSVQGWVMADEPTPTPALPTPQSVLEQRHLFQHQRAERMLTEMIRGAFLLNGGALIAVMPVVTAMVGQAAPARLDLRQVVLWFILGLLLAGCSALFAYIHADEEVDISEYRLRKAALPLGNKGPLGLPLKYGVTSALFLSMVSASAGFVVGAAELEKLSKPAPCPASEPWCNVPEIELVNDYLSALVKASSADQTDPSDPASEPPAPPSVTPAPAN